MLRSHGLDIDQLRYRLNLNHKGCWFRKQTIIILIKQNVFTVLMYLGENLTVMVFVKAVEHDAQPQNSCECKSTWKHNLIRLSFTTSDVSSVNCWVLTLKENQKITWLCNASFFFLILFLLKDVLWNVFMFKDVLGLIPAPKQNITIWHRFEDSC